MLAVVAACEGEAMVNAVRSEESYVVTVSSCQV